MKTRKYQSDDEKAILTAMIVSDRVLSKIHSHLKSEKRPFRSKWSNIIARMCLSYFGKYNHAPKKAIQSLFRKFAQSAHDEDAVSLVETFLVSLSEDFKTLSRELNEDYLIDSATRFFNQVKMEKLIEEISSDLENKEIDSAHEKFANFRPIKMATSDMVSVFDDEQAMIDAIFSQEEESLVLYPGALGEFFANDLCRDGLVSFLASEKKGKSMFLIDVAVRAAIFNKRKTIFYSCGDMSQRQMLRRFAARLSFRSLKKGKISIPKRIRKTVNDEIPFVETSEAVFKKSISQAEIKKALAKARLLAASRKSTLEMKCTPNGTTTVADIESDVQDRIRDGWIPDVIVIDYPDIMAPEIGSGDEFRHKTNETWKALRRLSQKFHLLVVVATQADAASYDAKLLSRKHFSEDKRKYAHVTAQYGINQTEDEKKMGVFRLNCLMRREGSYSPSKCVYVAGCLEIASPCMKSTF